MTERVFEASTCLGCGCTCDDIAVIVHDDRIVEARHACPLGVAWFGNGQVPTRSRVAGRDASLEQALGVTAQLLARASRLLVFLAPDLSCEAQREAIALADSLGAALDSITSATAMSAILAAQERGWAGATLGEVRNRADLLVFWGVDPASRYPRYWTRYAPEPVGLHLPEGRRSRTIVAVDVGDSRGPADADVRVAVPSTEELDTLTALGALVSGAILATRETVLGAPWVRARELAQPLLAGRYVVVVADAERDPALGLNSPQARNPGRIDALVALTLALNRPTRCALSTLRGGGNRSGADAVATWQTGYPTAVDFARRYPRYRPYDGTAMARLTRGDVDAMLVCGSAALMPADLLSLLARVPCAVLGPRASESALAACEAVIDTGVAGIHENGTAVRMDDVPLPLRPSLTGPPAAATLLRAVRARLAAGAVEAPVARA